MPRRVTAWACAWKCGHKVNTSRARIRDHERVCFRNPARRACKTCAHFEFWRGFEGSDREPPEPNEWVCTADGPGADNGWLDAPEWVAARTVPGRSEPGEVQWWTQIRWGCPGWEPDADTQRDLIVLARDGQRDETTSARAARGEGER